MLHEHLLLLIASYVCGAQLVFVSLPTNQTVIEGGDANFTCSATLNGNPDPIHWRLRGGEDNINQRVQLSTTNIPGVEGVVVTGPFRSPIILQNVSKSLDGLFVLCLGENQQGMIIEQSAPPAVLGVFYPPEYTASTDPTTVLEGRDFSYSFQFTANPPPAFDGFMWTKNNQTISDGRVAVSVSSITITGTVRDDSGVYQVTSSNAAGVGSASFTLNVQYPPEYASTAPVQHTQLMVGAPFALNCTPSAANPAVDTVSIEVDRSSVTSGDTVTVKDNIVAIPSVQRSHSGNYSCNVTNTHGSAVIYHNLLVLGPPSAPQAVAVSEVGPFTSQLTWTPPEDDGGVSDSSWDPALDGRENRPYLNYTVILTNETVTTMAMTQALFLLLSFLQHSTVYFATVQAENVYGRGPEGRVDFSTLDSVPIIGSVEVAVLSLFEVEVNISLLTNGGQNVTHYIVEINGTNYPFPSSEQMQVSALLNQLNANFTKGERLTLRALAVNSVGTSDPTSLDVIVPSPPNATAPTELDPANVPVCCAGVQLNLAKPGDPSIQVQVLVDGTLHPANQVVREGNFLYIMGLQAGTEYYLNITLSNILGTVWVNTTVRPLLGHPSTPQVILTPTAGELTVRLTVMYPGTRENTLQYSILTSALPRSSRQTEQQSLPVPDLTTPVSGSVEVALGPGTYSVTVTVTNQHGSTMSVPQQVTIPVPSGVETSVIIGVVVAVVTVFLILLILPAVITIVVCMKCKSTIRCRKSGPLYDDIKVELKGVHSHFEDVQLEPNPAYGNVTPPQAQTEPQPYEEFVAIGGVTSGDVALQDNPAYQSMDAVTAPETGEPLYL